MAAVKHIDSEFLGERISPVRTFTGDESVHAFAAASFSWLPAPPVTTPIRRHTADLRAAQWASRRWLLARRSARSFREIRELALQIQDTAPSQRRTVLGLKSKLPAELHVVAKFGMRIQWQMRAVNRHIMLEQQSQQFIFASLSTDVLGSKTSRDAR